MGPATYDSGGAPPTGSIISKKSAELARLFSRSDPLYDNAAAPALEDLGLGGLLGKELDDDKCPEEQPQKHWSI